MAQSLVERLSAAPESRVAALVVYGLTLDEPFDVCGLYLRPNNPDALAKEFGTDATRSLVQSEFAKRATPSSTVAAIEVEADAGRSLAIALSRLEVAVPLLYVCIPEQDFAWFFDVTVSLTPATDTWGLVLGPAEKFSASEIADDLVERESLEVSVAGVREALAARPWLSGLSSLAEQLPTTPESDIDQRLLVAARRLSEAQWAPRLIVSCGSGLRWRLSSASDGPKSLSASPSASQS